MAIGILVIICAVFMIALVYSLYLFYLQRSEDSKEVHVVVVWVLKVEH